MERKGKLPFDPKVFLSKVDGGRAIHDYRKDQIVFRQGDPADAVFYIQSGKVKNTVVSERGKEAVVGILGTGDFFGEGCLDGHPLRVATVSAMTELRDYANTKGRNDRVMHKQPEFAELFIADLLAGTVESRRTWSINCSIRARNGWRGSFLLLANFGKEARPEPIIAKVSQETLAEMIGTTRSRVSFFMNKFRKLRLN